MDIEKFIEARDLVRVHRENVRDNSIQGFVLASSENLLLLQYVADFRLDGLMVLRHADISEIEVSKTEIFQKKRLKDEAIFQHVDFSISYPIGSWFEFFVYAKNRHSYYVVEEECLENPEMTVGKIVKVGENVVEIECFTGAGRWLDDTVAIYFEDITACQIGSNYLNVYERYFDHKNA